MRFFATACIALCAFTTRASDSVRIASVPRAFSWNAPLTDIQVHSANSFTMKAAKTTDLYCFVDGSFYVHRVPMLLFRPDSAFIFSAHIKPQFKTLYDGAAIILYTDSSNWAKLLIEKTEGGGVTIGSSVVRNRATDDNYHRSVPAGRLYLKAVRAGKVYCFYCSTDGKKWELLRTFTITATDDLRIGFYAQSPKGEGITVDVSDLRYRPAPFKDFFTGE